MEKHKQHIFKIVLTGPESSGKTMLAEGLSAALDAVWAPEFARFFLAHCGYGYSRDDLHRIGRGQKAWENWYHAQAGRFLICDTDWTVLHIWEHFRFGPPADGAWYWQKGYGEAAPADLYLLCAPDFPPEPDPLRENPEERDILFAWYERLLQEEGLNYFILRDAPATRQQAAITQINKIFGTL